MLGTFLVDNVSPSVRVSLTVMRALGIWPPVLEGSKRILYYLYGFSCYMFIMGSFLIIQTVELCIIWGDLPLMTSVAYLLFTNLAHFTKIFYTLQRKDLIARIINEADEVLRSVDSCEAKAIVKSCKQESKNQQLFFFILSYITALGWISSTEKNMLPIRAWYPYDTSKSPAYELTYAQQVMGVTIGALLNVSQDTLVTSLIAQCCCRLRLLGLSLKTLCQDMTIIGTHLTIDQEKVVKIRLTRCVMEHQLALDAANQIQFCFSEQIFAQFNISLIIICVTAFQLVSQTGNLVRFLSMGTYMLNMMFQVFIYCYHGNELSEVSSEIAGAAYEAPWYMMSIPLRRSLLIVMVRSRRIAKITAGSFTTLSLASFMSIIKASYSLFTLLQQVEDKK
uniref:Odorant receptor n=1 Tax=Leucinodes orbonalis TaxID=711050 RepID=A0AAU0QJT9_9NEOP|nr:odorant receptor [Leucinodes orbonalis]